MKYYVEWIFFFLNHNLNIIITYDWINHRCIKNMNSTDLDSFLIRFSTLLPIMGFLIKLTMDAWSKSNNNTTNAISSIVQYSLMTLYLSIVIGLIIKLLRNKTITTNTNFNCFFAVLGFILIVYVSIIALYAIRYSKLQHGFITPSISESINNWIMVPLWFLIFYNMFALMECQKNANACSPTVSFYTLAIFAFGLMQLYIVHNSYNMVNLWPTDDIYYYK